MMQNPIFGWYLTTCYHFCAKRHLRARSEVLCAVNSMERMKPGLCRSGKISANSFRSESGSGGVERIRMLPNYHF
jgi:hypothetical protein